MINNQNQHSSGKGLKIVIALIFVLGFSSFFFFDGHHFLTLETINANRDWLIKYTEDNTELVTLIAIGVYITSTALSIPGAVLLSLLVGLLFGRWVGTLIIVFSAAIGASLIFLSARYLFAEAARKKLGKTATKMVGGFSDHAFNYLLFLRLVPIFPFWVVNLVPAFTPIKLKTYFLATLIGVIPGSFVFSNLGQSLGRISSLDQLISKETLLAFTLLGLFALIPVVWKKLKSPPGDKTKPSAEKL